VLQDWRRDSRSNRRIEERVRIASLAPAEGVVVVDRAHARGGHIGIASEIEARIEQAADVADRRRGNRAGLRQRIGCVEGGSDTVTAPFGSRWT
jgi:hypothetical protein